MKKIARKLYHAARRLAAWFRPAAHRRELYDWLGYLAPVVVALGWLTDGDVARIMSTVAGVLLLGSTKLAKSNAPDKLDHIGK